MSATVDYGPPSAEKMLGALPVVRDFLRRLDVAGTVDRLCPVREDVARLTHGQVVEALVANRLTSPAAMVRVTRWAADWAVEEVFGVPADALNDDRIARALDAFAEQAVGSVGAVAVAVFGLDLSQVHWDMTSISLHGAYRETDPDYATPRYGHPKDRRFPLHPSETRWSSTIPISRANGSFVSSSSASAIWLRCSPTPSQ